MRGTPVAALALAIGLSAQTYPIVGTGQTTCYNDSQAIACPQSNQAFYGQDAQHPANQPRYSLSADGLTVYDQNTGLTWQRSPDTNGDGSLTMSDKLTWPQAQAQPAKLNASKFGGFGDWRLPTIKELYSLIEFTGTDPGGYSGTDTSGLTPFIDTKYFKFAYGQTSLGERIIDSQYASSNMYANKTWQGYDKLFGVNFADGRIKGYDLTMPGGAVKTFFVQCVRGGNYGVNSFAGNADGTIADSVTGLMWARADSGSGMNWQDALAWVQTKNAQNYLGYNDWRMPNAKELQSIVDYTRSPDSTASAAINPAFTSTQIVNEAGQPDYPCYWADTTHALAALPLVPGGVPSPPGGEGVYVAFGRAMGYMDGAWQDVHGAGAQRSDPKNGNPADYPTGHGPQGDAIRIYNFVRLVRAQAPALTTVSAASYAATAIAPGSIASAFGSGLAGGTVTVKDSSGTERAAQVLAAVPTQINFVVPAATAVGQATITVSNVATSTVMVDAVAPGLFSANADGKGVAAALAVHVKSDGSQIIEPVFKCGAMAGSCVAAALDLGAASDQLFVSLFGTGMRGFKQQAVATVGGISVGVVGPVAQSQYVGLDQVNLGPLPRSLAGRGEIVIGLTVDGKTANPVTVHIQ